MGSEIFRDIKKKAIITPQAVSLRYIMKVTSCPQSKHSQVTLLHFIVRTYMRSRGGALSPTCALPVPEPGDVVRAAALDFADVADGLKALRDRLQGA